MADKRVEQFGTVEPGYMCCGLAEYDGLNSCHGPGFTPEGAVAAIAVQGYFNLDANDRAGDGFCQVIMTQMIPKGTTVKDGCKNLNAFVAYVKKHRLGSIGVSAAKVNPNSGNRVKGAIFAPNARALRDWMRINGVRGERPYRGYW